MPALEPFALIELITITLILVIGVVLVFYDIIERMRIAETLKRALE